MKKLISILLILVMSLTVLLCSCGDKPPVDTNTDTNTNTGTSTDTDKDTGTDTSKDSSSGSTSTDTSVNSKPNDTDNQGGSSGTSFDTPIEHNLKVDNSVKLDVFASENTFGNEGNTVDYTNATPIDVSEVANGKTYSIVKGGVYRVYGKTDNGQILINLKDAVNRDVVLVLDNLEMTYSGTKSVIFAEKCNSVKIVIPANTTTTLSDTTNNLEKGVIHVRSGNLTLDGKGTLNLNATAEKSRGVFNTKTLTINGGIYNVTTAHSHGIQGEEGVVINGGTFTINSAKSGLKTGDFDENKADEAVTGTMTINGGSISINSTTNGISAYGSVNINNGRIVISSVSDGIDASEAVTFNGGITDINAKNDGIKCDASVSILGTANLRLLAGNDGIDTVNVDISTCGIVYIKSNVDNNAFVVDPNGSYIIKNGRFTLVDTSKYPEETYYSLESCKGIKADGNITIENATLGVDSYEDALDGASIEIKSGRVVLASNDDGIDISGGVVINGALEIMNSNKGIKAPTITVEENGVLTVISTSDAIDSPLVTVNGGVVFLFEKLDLTDGKLIVNGGTVIAASSTKNAVSAETIYNNISVSGYSSTSNAIYGNWLRITDGEKSIALRLPKSYEGKLSVTCISEDITSGTYMIEIGTYQVGDKINNFVYVDGEFVAIDSYDLTLQ